MKKLIAVLIALAMVLSMSVMSFAEYSGKKNPGDIQATYNTDGSKTPEDFWNTAVTLDNFQLNDFLNFGKYINTRNLIDEQGMYKKDDGSYMNWTEAWQAYYSMLGEILKSNPMGAMDIINEIKATTDAGYVATGDAIKMIGDSVMGGAGGDGGAGDLSGIIDQIIGGGSQQPEVTTEAYVEELKTLINSGADFDTITTKISDDLASGKIVVNQLPDIAKGLTALIDAGQIENNETVQKVLEFIGNLGGEGEGVTFPDFGDITLPGDTGNSESGSFLDTILGIIGSIGDIFNPGAGDEPTPDEPADPGMDEPTTIPDTGDVSFVAVAAVAAVAGAALILTRKKNDAE